MNSSDRDDAFLRRMRQSVDRLAALAGEMLGRATHDHPSLDGGPLAALLAQRPAAAATTATADALPPPLLFAS